VDTPSNEEVRERSELLSQMYPGSDPDRDRRLGALLADDAPVVSSLTGRRIGPPDTPGEEVPAWLRPVAIRAMALRAERHAVGGSARGRRSTLGSLNLRSFTAGPYSESYFGPGDAAEWRVLDPDPAVHELLWALCTEEMRRYWLRLWGRLAEVPAFGVQSFDWRGAPGAYGRRRGPV